MTEGRFISYLRVSTQRQGRSGLGLEAQRTAVTGYLNGGKWALIEEVVEVESGTRKDRPALEQALALCRVHGAVLLVAKLDRLARNVAFISALMESGVEFVAVDLPQANRLTVHIMAAMAEYEAQAISARTKAALIAAKARGVKLGGRRWAIESVAKKGNKASVEARASEAHRRASDVLPVIRRFQDNGAKSLREVAKALNDHKIRAPRGGQWSAVQIQRVLNLKSSPDVPGGRTLCKPTIPQDCS